MKMWPKFRQRYLDWFLRPVFWTVLLLVLQVGLLTIVLNRLHTALTYAVAFWYVLQVALMIYMINKPQNPAYKLAWMVPMCLVPIFGALLYLFIQFMPGAHRLTHAVERNMKKAAVYLPQNTSAWTALKEKSEGDAALAHYLYQVGFFPVYENTTLRYFASGEAAFADMKTTLLKAKESIFIEFFIIREGRMLAELVSILKSKVREGVEVRFLSDGTNIFRLSPQTIRAMKEKGISCRVFAPVRPILSTYQNNRDHRKLMLIDGEIGYCGSLNISDEYINRKRRFGDWKDAAVRLEGEAVVSMTALFLQLWHVSDPEMKDLERYLKPRQSFASEHSTLLFPSFVIPYGDAPIADFFPGEMVYLHMLYQAKKYVHIMTPYFVPDHELLQAMCFAAQRGVEVKLLMPAVPDKKMLYHIARSYFPQLIAAGVRVYTFTPGFVHSKIFVSDDRIATVGSVNLDYRSLYLHYENGVFVHDADFAADVEVDFHAAIGQSQEMTIANCNADPLWQQLIGRSMRVFSPLF